MRLESIGTAFGVRPCGRAVPDTYGSRIAVTRAFDPNWTDARRKEAVLMLSEMGLSPIGIGAHLGIAADAVARLSSQRVRREPAACGVAYDGEGGVAGLTTARRRCLLLVLGACEGARLSHRTIADETGLSVGAVRRAIVALAAGGYLTVTPGHVAAYRLTAKGRAARVEAAK